MMPNKTKIPNSKTTNNNVSDVKTDASFLPLELVIGDLTNDNNSNTTTRHDEYITKSILEFFNLALPSSNGSEKSVDWTKTKKIIDALNFIRFGGANPAASSDQSAATLSLGQHQPITSSGDSKQGVPCFSLVLLTNSPSTCRPLVDQDHESTEEVIGSARNWFFHYKIELNDDRGKPIARQVFYRLKSPTSSSLPLCCRSNWISPMQQQRSPALPTSSPALPPPTKYIVRLNINCQNYDLMLFFYRLLFEKCPNYSKKDFSLFILSQHRYPLCENTSNTEQSGKSNNNNDEMIVEFQLSLKHDESCVRAIEKLPSTYLVFNVDERRTFDNIVHLLDGFVEPIVYGKIYSVLDPDRNRVFIVDRSSSSSLSSSTGLVVDTTTKLEECASSPSAETIGLADKYYSLFNNWSHLLSPKSKQQPNSYSPNSNCSSCSSSETSSFDSGKDSGNWSGSNSNPIMKCAKVLNEQFLSINNNTPTPIINNISHNNNGLFSKDFNYKQLHSLSGNYDLLTECQTNNNSQEKRLNKQQQQQQQQLDASNADYIGVKHLIKKFSAALNPNPTDTINNRSISSSVCSNKPASKERKRQTAAAVISNFAKFNHHHTRVISDDSEDYDEYSGDEEEDNERELRNLLKKASNSSMFALNALAYKNKSNYNYPLLGNHIHRRPKQEPTQLKSDSMNHKQSLIDLTYRRNPRSRSALNEPYLPTNPSSAHEYNQFNNNSRHFNTIDYNNHHSRNHQHNRSHRQQYDNSNQYSHQSRPSSIGYSAGTRLLKSVLHSANSNNSSGYNNLIDSSCSSLNRKKSKSVTFMDALSNSHQQQSSKSNKSFIGTNADEGNISNRRDFLANPIISNNLMSRSKSTVPFFKPDHANNRPYSDYNDDDEYRYNEDEYDYDDQDEYESYTCVDVDNYNSSSGGDLRSTTPTTQQSANKCYLDNNTKMAKLISNGISYHDYLSFCEQQQQQQPQTSLIDDLRASRRGAHRDLDNIESKYNGSNQQAKPYVGITAATRFRRAHTLDMIRSTKMPLNVIPDIKQQPQKHHHHQQQQSIKSNDPQSFNFINKNNSSPLQFNSSKLVARF